MNAQTKMSAKGQVVIPKAVRERLRMRPGQLFDVVETAEGVLLRRVATPGRLSFEEALARIRKIVRYDGPTVGIDEMKETIRQGWREAAERSDHPGD